MSKRCKLEILDKPAGHNFLILASLVSKRQLYFFLVASGWRLSYLALEYLKAIHQ